MHVITYWPNFAPPHFAAHGIPKNTPHSTMEGHTASIYMLSVYPFQMELFSFSLYTKHTLGKFPRLLLFYARHEMYMPLFQPRLSPQEQTSIPTCISMTYFDVYTWIMFIHMQICLLSDVITSGNRSSCFVHTTQ